jgi:hypothetical protein
MDRKDESKSAKQLFVAAMSLYVISFMLPAWRESSSSLYGCIAFLLGLWMWIGIPLSLVCALFQGAGGLRQDVADLFRWAIVSAPWLANPVFWTGLCCWGAKKHREVVIAGSVAFVLAFSFPINGKMGFQSLQADYYLWLLSFALLGLSGLVFFRVTDKPNQEFGESGWFDPEIAGQVEDGEDFNWSQIRIRVKNGICTPGVLDARFSSLIVWIAPIRLPPPWLTTWPMTVR